MALEAVVFQQDPFIYGGSYAFGFQQQEQKANCCNTEEMLAKSGGFGFTEPWGSPFSSLMVHKSIKESPRECSNSSSPDIGFATSGSLFSPKDSPPVDGQSCRRKRRHIKSVKNREDIENQRMTHIAVERNRRRQMNDYLAVLRSMMPNSYVQKGDQASIIGGAINFVKELEQFLQSLEARKRMGKRSYSNSSLFSDFFSFPQYSSSSTATNLSCAAVHGEKGLSQSSSVGNAVADVEVTMVESHANLKILSRKHPKQLFNMISGLHFLGLLVLHINVTSVENMVLYSLSVKVEENCQLTTVNEIAAAVYEMVDSFQGEAAA